MFFSHDSWTATRPKVEPSAVVPLLLPAPASSPQAASMPALPSASPDSAEARRKDRRSIRLRYAKLPIQLFPASGPNRASTMFSITPTIA
ncbi:hypothetical protein NWFMUON74_66550 [Nocardia wallacei]|uniref:Uncharacterized protein n=1 Tax=Nocardia wallacei TaxID=480035 RepID=A0A7G1KXD9_9NOCA|nr:hypothetical protein NWFMUON74_66550 [Nocardia wallacei]